MARYFAYGSNMDAARMESRVPEARDLGRAVLRGYRFACNKIGRDGTAKANLVPAPGELVWGVVWELDDAGLRALDRFEGGYWREEVSAELSDGTTLACVVYRSDLVADDLLPSPDYVAHVVRGARSHGLPAAWRRLLEGLTVAAPAPS
jgi:gamma-glutamylcyclotransferase (GGCT)/AIG2-like uncharacterized protein YtfP